MKRTIFIMSSKGSRPRKTSRKTNLVVQHSRSNPRPRKTSRKTNSVVQHSRLLRPRKTSRKRETQCISHKTRVGPCPGCWCWTYLSYPCDCDKIWYCSRNCHNSFWFYRHRYTCGVVNPPSDVLLWMFIRRLNNYEPDLVDHVKSFVPQVLLIQQYERDKIYDVDYGEILASKIRSMRTHVVMRGLVTPELRKALSILNRAKRFHMEMYVSSCMGHHMFSRHLLSMVDAKREQTKHMLCYVDKPMPKHENGFEELARKFVADVPLYWDQM